MQASIYVCFIQGCTISRKNIGPGDINLFQVLYWLHLPFIFFTVECPCIGMALSCAKWEHEALCLKSSLRMGTAERRTTCKALLSTGPCVTVRVSSLGSQHYLHKLSAVFHSFHWVKHQRCSHKANTNFLINSHKKWNRFFFIIIILFRPFSQVSFFLPGTECSGLYIYIFQVYF